MDHHKSRSHIVQSDILYFEDAYLIFKPTLIFCSATRLVLSPGFENTVTQLADWGDEAIILQHFRRERWSACTPVKVKREHCYVIFWQSCMKQWCKTDQIWLWGSIYICEESIWLWGKNSGFICLTFSNTEN